MFCPLCHQEYTDNREVEFIDNTGMCAKCDHLQADCKHENTIDVGDAEHYILACTDCKQILEDQDVN
jgi:hypothetical protein